MIKFLTTLLALLNKLFGAWQERRWKRQGRQETIKEMNDALNEQVRQAEEAVANPDPDDVERMRARFDRSRNS